MHSQESQMQQKIITGWICVGDTTAPRGQVYTDFHQPRGEEEALGVWCNLWSQALNIHLPVHKPAQL